MERRAFTIRALALTAALSSASCVAASAATDSVTLGLSSFYPTYAVYYAAKELGYYSAASLDVDIRTLRSGAAAAAALAAGAIDVAAISPAAAAQAQQKGAKTRIVASFAPPRPAGWFVMVPASSPIKTFADLNGKSIGVTQTGSLIDGWVQQLAASSKINVTSVPLGGGGAIESALNAHKVDAVVWWPPGSYNGLLDGDLRAIVDLEASLAPAVWEGVAATQDTIDRRGDVLKRFLIATAKAANYMKAHDSWTIGFLKRTFNDPGLDDKAIALLYNNFVMKINTDGAMHADWQVTGLKPLGPSPPAPKAEQVFVSTFTPVHFR